jgi:hypothetical protein
MATSSRRRRVVVFMVMAMATVALAAIAIDQALVHTTIGRKCWRNQAVTSPVLARSRKVELDLGG